MFYILEVLSNFFSNLFRSNVKEEVVVSVETEKESNTEKKVSEKRKTTNIKKLTCEQIESARIMVKSGNTISNVCKKFGVSASTLSRAISCKSYKKCCKK